MSENFRGDCFWTHTVVRNCSARKTDNIPSNKKTKNKKARIDMDLHPALCVAPPGEPLNTKPPNQKSKVNVW